MKNKNIVKNQIKSLSDLSLINTEIILNHRLYYRDNDCVYEARIKNSTVRFLTSFSRFSLQ